MPKRPCWVRKKPNIILNPFLILYQLINNISDIISISQYHPGAVKAEKADATCDRMNV